MVTPIDWLPLVVVYLILSTVAVGLRSWIRLRVTNSWAQDDVMLVMAQAGMVAHFGIYFAVCAIYPRTGLDVDEQTYYKINTLWFWATFCYAGSQVALKLSMGLFFLTLARVKWQRLIILIPTGIFVAYNTALGIILVFRCGASPVSPFIVMTRKECAVDGLAFTKLIAANGTFTATLDWIFAIVPIFMVIQSRSLDARSRKAVWFLIMLAMAGSVVSVIRIPFTKDYQFGPE
ncbi:hypothetical protein BDZ85DRAFT_125150 [Elsinoe ampelina]|uniref:Rhodopsin domain-containing protein n=1 Tax=Elsinoe ampelina TaxID=302913 RepID=A0A6A6FXJ9_9PEZI|nr:hypothetical protein BDZ85DRAFT_125150 [Elsinoe ampelina]